MTFKIPLITLSLIVLLSACGGGGNVVIDSRPQVVDTDNDGVADGNDAFPNDPTETADTDSDGVGDNSDPFPTISGINLFSFDETTDLQSINLHSDIVAIGSGVKSKTSAQWNSNMTLDYVVLLQNGDVVGIPISTIPASGEFVSTGTASVLLVDGSNQYGLTDGDLIASISDNASNLTAKLSWSGAQEIAFSSEDLSEASPAAIDITLTSANTGTTVCGGSNMFCGGTMSITADGTLIAIDQALNAQQYKAGVFGSSATNVELGGRISYIEQDVISVVGGFVADTR